ncbi:MAG: spore maturation protein [Bacillaceae bacterium]|jgi:spore maturation protein B|uniref:Spore maturation protein n=2 Tax=Aeribacillus TaxID=1055323 RepID=A0A165XD93_9BACI|nr:MULTISPECIES: spore maturation protein [Aeribacillus]AXI40064.1 spore maturation protein [Bacillaceae bacterium ZC4]REJ17526.1 MAG: spore maturation protein [Bacillaceae bacterium]ASS91785.1 spore maturation protein [Aeribacillus pallidus]KZM56915.1 spore maturation protein [Aeribacillus pallidus]KZN95896.1 spore maturation protein [Aeribacillus pallidus]
MVFISAVSIWLIPLIIGFILLYGTFKRIPTYEAFVEGGKEGIEISFSIIPYLVGMLVAVSVFRASGALDFFMDLLKPMFQAIHVPAEIVPLALIRPISGTASLGIMSDLISMHGADSLIGRLAATMQGSTDTTLYIITVYFGAVGIKRMGDAIKVGLLADFAAILSSIIIVTLLFG